MRPSREREQTLLADWFNAVHYDGELPDWTEADPGDDEDEAVVAGARPVDGDGDGFVYDGTPRQRPWNPVTDASYPDGKIPEVVRKRQSVARQKARISPFAPVDRPGELGGAATVPESPVKLTTKINTLAPDFTPEQSEKFAAFLTRQTGMTQYASDKYLPTNVRGFAQGYSTREWLDPLFTSDNPDPDAVALVQAWRKALVDHIGEKGGDAIGGWFKRALDTLAEWPAAALLIGAGLLAKRAAGRVVPNDVVEAERDVTDLTLAMTQMSICSLGGSAPNPLATALTYFPNDARPAAG